MLDQLQRVGEEALARLAAAKDEQALEEWRGNQYDWSASPLPW